VRGGPLRNKSGGLGPCGPPGSVTYSRSGKKSEVFGGAGFLTALGVRVGFFCPTPTSDIELDYFLHHTPKLGIAIEMVHFLLKLLLKQRISCWIPRFPLILIAN